MTASAVFLLLLVLACPLMMMFMMRGGHGHGSGQGGHAGGCHGTHGHEPESHQATDELRHQRDELDRQIAEREAEEETPTPVGGGWR